MPADRLLSTLLRALQDYSPDQETPRILGTAASLLTTLNNPLNVTLLVSHVSKGPALWTQPDGLRFCLSYMGIFHSAVQRISQRELAELQRRKDAPRVPLIGQEPHLSLRHWITAVLTGLDEHAPRSHHVLALAGIINGLSKLDLDFVPPSVRAPVHEAFVKATNLALSDPGEVELGRQATVLALNYTFSHLSDFEREQLDYDAMLPVAVATLLHSEEGLSSGRFLQAVNQDVVRHPDASVTWPATSMSFAGLQRMTSGPLITSIGPLSRLVAHAVENCRDSWQVSAMVDDVAELSRRLYALWRSSPLSEADKAPVVAREGQDRTQQELWKLFRNIMFAITIMLRSAIGRLLADRTLSQNDVAPHIATQCLQCLHDLNFIFARISSSAFSQWTFIHLASIDILNTYPPAALSLLKTISPSTSGVIPTHPLDRISNLYFLNTAEHFTLTLPPSEAEALLLSAAAPYLTAAPTPDLVPNFEAAHAVMLAIFSAPQNADLTTRHLPFYTEALFHAFPQNLSARQFRLAFKNLVRIVSPPGEMARRQPDLAGVLMELVRHRAETAGTAALPMPVVEQDGIKTPALSEQAVLVATIIDALPFVSVELLDEWLPLVPVVIHQIHDLGMRMYCEAHLWETFVGGAMDPDRSLVCVEWWTTGGGRESVVRGRTMGQAPYVMSGALPPRAGARL